MATGPGNHTAGELGRYGLGVVVRALRVPGSPASDALLRVYCIPCGLAISHDPPLSEWWICARGCNADGDSARASS